MKLPPFLRRPSNTCQFTIYVECPGVLADSEIRQKRAIERGRSGLADVGHVFIGLTDRRGREERVGYNSRMAIEGNENLPPRERISGPGDLFKRVSGVMFDEKNTAFQDSISYEITPKQYEKIRRFVDTWKKNPPTYVMGTHNCVSFALKAARKGGVRRLPPSLVAGVPAPHATSFSIRLKEAYDRRRAAILKAGDRMTKIFGREKTPVSGKAKNQVDRNHPKDHKLRIYVERPAFMVSKKARREEVDGRDGTPAALLSTTGHAFIGIVDSKGRERKIGFHAKSFWYGPENVPEEDRIGALTKDAFKKVSGFLRDEKKSRYDDMLEYPLSKDQYKAVKTYIREFESRKEAYSLLTNNCCVFAHNAARAAGVKPPPALTGFHTPHGLTLSVRASRKLKTWQADLRRQAGKISAVFSADRKVPAARKAGKDAAKTAPFFVRRQGSAR